MSRQNKARQKAITAAQFSEIRKNGGSGPARTTPKHGKVKTLRALEAAKRIADAEKAAAAASIPASKAPTKANTHKKPAGAARPQSTKPQAGRKVASGAVAK